MTGLNGFKAAEVETASSPPRRPTGLVFLNGASPRSESTLQQSNFRNRSISNGTFSTTFPPPPDIQSGLPRLSSVGSINESIADGSQSPLWSSAVGRATTGKSGRVIERLQAENDRLKRDLKLECLKREEEQRKWEMARGKMESLQASNDNFVQMREVDRMGLARRERKIEEMRLELSGERSRRVQAETQLQDVMKEGQRVEQELRSQAREDAERAKKANSQYEVLSSSWRQLDEGYRRKTDKVKKDMGQLSEKREQDRVKLEKLETVVEQQRQETSRMRSTKDELARALETFKKETADGTRDLRQLSETHNKANAVALQETLTVLGEMKHVINMKKYVRDAQ